MPDPDTFELLPWGDPKTPEARIFCDIHHLDGTPFEGDPRQVLRRHVQDAHDEGHSSVLTESMYAHRLRRRPVRVPHISQSG